MLTFNSFGPASELQFHAKIRSPSAWSALFSLFDGYKRGIFFCRVHRFLILNLDLFRGEHRKNFNFLFYFLLLMLCLMSYDVRQKKKHKIYIIFSHFISLPSSYVCFVLSANCLRVCIKWNYRLTQEGICQKSEREKERRDEISMYIRSDQMRWNTSFLAWNNHQMSFTF